MTTNASVVLAKKPDHIPFELGTHGAPNVDCATEWSPGWKLKMMVSPTAAVSVSGW